MSARAEHMKCMPSLFIHTHKKVVPHYVDSLMLAEKIMAPVYCHCTEVANQNKKIGALWCVHCAL